MTPSPSFASPHTVKPPRLRPGAVYRTERLTGTVGSAETLGVLSAATERSGMEMARIAADPPLGFAFYSCVDCARDGFPIVIFDPKLWDESWARCFIDADRNLECRLGACASRVKLWNDTHGEP